MTAATTILNALRRRGEPIVPVEGRQGLWRSRCPECGGALTINLMGAAGADDVALRCAGECDAGLIYGALGLPVPRPRARPQPGGQADTRGPATTASGAPPSPYRSSGPLVSGPLGPLVSSRNRRSGRIDLFAVQERLESYLGADAETGRFECPLPGHGGAAMLGVPPGDPDADLRLLCCGGRWRSLGEVRAAEAYGCDRMRTNIEIATWLRRLLYEAGAFEPVHVPMPELPEDAREHVREARKGFGLLIGLRWADGPRRAVPFAVRFCAAWCRLSQRPASLAIKELIRLGVIRQAGDPVGRGARRMRLYLPGEIAVEASDAGHSHAARVCPPGHSRATTNGHVDTSDQIEIGVPSEWDPDEAQAFVEEVLATFAGSREVEQHEPGGQVRDG